MSQILETLRNRPATALGGTDKQFLDADTLVGGDGEKYRIQGVDAGEVSKIVGGEFKAGTAGGEVATNVITELANKEGYTNVAPRIGPDGQPIRDEFGRVLTDLRNREGKSFGTELLKAGAFDVNRYTLDSQIAARDIAEAKRNRAKLEGDYSESAFDTASAAIKQAEMDEGAKQQGFKVTALNEAQRAMLVSAGLGHALTDDVQVRHFDRSLMNDSNNPLSDAWDLGWQGAKEGMYGMMELLGEEFDNQWLNDIGEDGIHRMRAKQESYGNILTDYKDVDSFGSAMQFLGNNVAMSLPYMAITAAGAAAGTAATAATGGGTLAVAGGLAAGLTPSASVYAGQVWNEMEGEKDAATAVGAGIVQASLDRLGFGGLAGKLVPDRAFQQGVKHIMEKQGVSKDVAQQMLAGATKQEARLLTQEALKVASKQQAAKQIGMDMIKRSAVSGGFEGITEVGQEATAYMAATLGSDKQFNWEELNERMVAAAIAGGAIGAGLSAPGSARQAVQEAEIIYGGKAADEKTASQSQIYAAEERDAKGYVPSIDENILEMNQRGEGFESHRDRADAYRKKQKAKPLTDRFVEAVQNPGALFKGATANIFSPELQEQSRAARQLADMFGGNLQRIYSGANFENFKFHQVATYKNMVSRPEAIFSALGDGKRMGRKQKKEVSAKAYEVMNKAINKEGEFDPNLIPDGPHKATYIQLAQDLQRMSDAMYKDQKQYNPELGYQKNYLMKYKALSKEAVHKNQKQFKDLLMSEYNYDAKDAADLVHEITTNPEANDIDEAFSVIKGGPVPGSHKKRSLGLSENAKFADFMEQDLFANLSQAAKSAARYNAHQKFIGKNGSVVSKFLDQMEAEGIPKDQVNKVASQLQDYLDAESGNYKRPTSSAGKRAQRIQKNMMMFMTMSGLPLATISSFVELMLVNRGLKPDQIWGKDGSLQAMGKEGGAMVLKEMGKIANLTTGKEISNPNVGRTQAQQQLEELGFYDWDVGAATVTGVTEVNAFQRQMYETFFKAIGLQQWTDFTRAARASVGADYMLDNAEIYWAYKTGGGDYTRDVQQAEEKLRNLGLDVDRFAEIQTKVTGGIQLTPDESKFFQDSVREGTFNFVNEAIALPGASNRPLIYQDPRFALFTQFQGFIATFTANHIPKLWGEYVKRGTPGMKYNAFATMATMIMMGFLSQHLKDYIKYGDDEEDYERKTGLNPYLDTAEYVQRGVYASGLLGVAERPLQWINPIYEQRHDGVADWAFNNVVGESPALSWAERVGKAGLNIASGDVSRGVEQLGKAAPGIGPFSNFNRKAGQAFEDWNFNGEQ